MTLAEANERVAAISTVCQKAMHQHQLAITAFNVACARYDWATAEKEQALALHHMGEYLDSVAACHKVSESLQ